MDGSADAVTSTEIDGIAVITLTRPPVNAVDLATIEAITDAVASASVTWRGIVLRGEGTFSAGVDRKFFAGATADERAHLAHAINAMLATVVGLDIPVVAAVDGVALGGGLVLAMACDERVALEHDLTVGLPEAAAGIGYSANAVHVLQQALPGAVLDQLTLADRRLDGPAAEQLGLVRLAPTDVDLLGHATARARALAELAGFATVKRQFRRDLRRRLDEVVTTRDDPIIAEWNR